jgi:hypothetical protein
MRKRDLFNQLKQEQYKTDIEALKWRMWALECDDAKTRADYESVAEREESEAMGIFKVTQTILGDYKGTLDDTSARLLDEYLLKRADYRALCQEIGESYDH